MASVDYKKLHGPQEVKAMLRHCDIDERQKSTHSNKDINTALTRGNVQGPETYQEICDVYDKRIEWLDMCQGANIRKDRVTCFGLSIPVPKEMTDGKMQAGWMGRVLRCVADQYGDNNILQFYGHWDEVHDYTDAETGDDCTSRPHLHVFVIPEHDGKLNGKWFSNTANMKKLNQSIQDMTQQYYGMAFMDGSKRKSRKEVETLKNESLKREIENRQLQLATLDESIATAQKLQRRLLEECGVVRRECDEAVTARNAAVEALQGDLEAWADLTPRPTAARLLGVLNVAVEASKTKAARELPRSHVGAYARMVAQYVRRPADQQSGPIHVEGPKM